MFGSATSFIVVIMTITEIPTTTTDNPPVSRFVTVVRTWRGEP